MAADPNRQRVSVEEYLRLERVSEMRHEYIDGYAYAMSGGTATHSWLGVNVVRLFDEQLRSDPCFVVGSAMRVKVSESSYYFPDVTVSCDVADRRRGNTLIRSPRIVVDVLSPSTEKLDRSEKMKRYQAKASIQEVLLISQFDPYVEVFRRSAEDAVSWDYATYELGEVVVIDSLDIQIPIEEIYEDIDFDEPLVEE